jgi:hypothetical protein
MIVSLNSINGFVSLMEAERVSCEVRSEFIYIGDDVDTVQNIDVGNKESLH